MDGLDLSALDESIFKESFSESENEDESFPVPECIGVDSAVQDDENSRIQSRNNQTKEKTRNDRENELELKMLRPNSIRRQMLEKSLHEGKSNKYQKSPTKSDKPNNGQEAHVMNIVEKAGMNGIDKERINEIIHQASEGSMFYKKQAQRQEEIHRSIEKMLNKVKVATPDQVVNARLQCDKLLADLKKQRLFNRVIVHFDLDMFYAAVEIRDNPELASKPVAVGGDSMVSTSNYIARKFGVRAAMPGFIARKLCPDLVFIKPNGYKYRQASSQVFAILERYDPELVGMSLDEAYLDLTDYVKNTLERDGLESDEYYDGLLPKVWWTRSSEIVSEIRKAIYDATKLTCSAGIACNTLLAKISTDLNKPNGQFMVEGYPETVEKFIKDTPVGKVSGIGKVSCQFLNALDIKTCGDIFDKRHYLPLVFYEINVRFYLRVALGDGSTCIKSDEHRKSKSVERTFTAVKDTLILLDKLDSICEELCTKYLKPYRIRGRTITVKLKRNTFTTTTKSYSLLVPTNDKLVVYSTAKNLLLAETANEPPEISYRLLGVRLSNLADDNVTAHQPTIDALFRQQELGSSSKSRLQSDGIPVQDENSNSSSSLWDKTSLFAMEGERVSTDLNESKITDHIDHHQEPQSSSGSKRKQPPEAKIENFFQSKDRKQPRVESSQVANGINSIEEEVTDKIVSESQQQDLVGTQFNNEPNVSTKTATDEDFLCPHCVKSFIGFSQLESHVASCPLKDSMDFYKVLSQRPPSRSPLVKKEEIAHERGSKKTKKLKSAKESSSQSIVTRSSTKSHNTTPKIATQRSKTPEVTPNLFSRCGSSQKISFYQKFIETNSPSSQAASKVDPFQCPYCLHGFITFERLQNHVIMCTKNDKN